jgi:hypothetical protein
MLGDLSYIPFSHIVSTKAITINHLVRMYNQHASFHTQYVKSSIHKAQTS